MKVLVVGKGGREHALCWRLSQSQTVRGLYCASGNPGINRIAQPVALAPGDIAGLLTFARDNSIDLTVVGPEEPLAAGIVDEFTRAGLHIFGPTRAAAKLETSKSFAKNAMREAGVPTADFAVFDDFEAARRYLADHPGPIVVKADGLALGKGVTVCPDTDSALNAVADAMQYRRFGSAGARVVIEQCLRGEELSFFALCDGENALALGMCQDHKAVFDGDSGPNTGGMGAYSPVPQFDGAFGERVLDQVVRPTLRTMKAQGTEFRGVLFVGLMIDKERMNVLEFNVRFGDPECQPLMMRFQGDLAEALLAAAEGRLDRATVSLAPASAASVVLASDGYPGEYRKGIPIAGLEQIEGAEPSDLKVKWALDKVRVKVFHAGTALRDGQLVTEGGRVLAVTALAPRLGQALEAAYEGADLIKFEGKHMRRDIGRRALDYLARNRM